MNLFLDYQKKIFNNLKNLGKKKLIQIPSQLNLTVELPPKNQNADISCNAAMILAKINNNSPVKLAKIFKKHLLLNFKEFESIEIAGPGFLNICFHISFWKEYLTKVIKLDSKYGSIKNFKKKYNIDEMVKGDVMFCASGVTDGDLVDGIKDKGDSYKASTYALHKDLKICKKITNIHKK